VTLTPLRMAAVTTVTAALAFYTAGTVAEQRARRATGAVRLLLAAGVACDVVATVLMVVATGRFALTVHGVLGYSALAAMLVDTVLLWRHAARAPGAEVPAGLHRYSRIAYAYWVVAFVTGAALVAMQGGMR